MPPIPFYKFHGFGNDYIVIEKSEVTDEIGLPELAKAICRRHTGAGADGIAIIEKISNGSADYYCEIVNPDGSYANFSGNGTRCAVSYLYYKKLWTDTFLRLATRSGVKNFELLETIADGSYRFRAEIGKPRFSSSAIPLKPRPQGPIESVIDFPIELGKHTYSVSCVNVGNPVACLFVGDFDLEWRIIGRELEVHEVFPEHANIVFVRVIDRENIKLKIWERGAGETSASGTCASGAAILGAFTGRCDRHVSVHTDGGVTDVVWRDDDEILLTGRADFAYCGEWPVLIDS
ncbi:MAG: diaminopimelate epimerase [Acidobacteria bacterium]|nr:diaminopimelate epimerase [Acidobacteriota bacterium]